MDALLLTRIISGSVVRAILFGLYSASFIHCVRWLLFEDEGWRVRKKVSWSLVTTTLLIFFLSMGLLCAGWMKRFGASGRLRPVIWSLDILDCNGIQCSILIVIDGVLIHRCWTVSSKNWFIISFPLVLWCFCLTCAILSFYCNLMFLFFFSSGLHGQDLALQQCFMPYDSVVPLAFYTCNIVINIYTTTVLVYKIWCAVKNSVGTNRLYKLCRVLTESGILYTLSSIVYLISWIRNYSVVSKHAIEYITLSTEPFLLQPFAGQIAMNIGMFIPGIAFNLIIIRVGEQRAKEEDTWVDARNDPVPPELLDHNTERGDINGSWQEGHERTDEGKVMASNGTEVGDIVEVDSGSGNFKNLP
ncbi:hypothetical protein M378DRAFT_131077 [Amanita muscaria Koide BX008]|uniref:Uncharacterized protein n=1 Tax=Amanita muscaria (strain Koide BX008) TaxID=946122 RepID=A0A0C2WUB1_AMAMK|nr:hypothetical protein M378DRAFT_131077 [Amanita muscaria Koide BX008]